MIDTVALDPNRHVPGARQHPRVADTLHAEWVKLWSVRSTRWSLALLFLLGAGLTTLVCWAAADAIAAGGLVLHELGLVTSSLEEAFMTLTAGSVEFAAARPAEVTR